MLSIAIPEYAGPANAPSSSQIRRMMSEYERLGWEMEEEISKGEINLCRYDELVDHLMWYHNKNFNGLPNMPLFMSKLMDRNVDLYCRCNRIMTQVLYQYLTLMNLPLNENHCPECRGELNNEDESDGESDDESNGESDGESNSEFNFEW